MCCDEYMVEADTFQKEICSSCGATRTKKIPNGLVCLTCDHGLIIPPTVGSLSQFGLI